MVEAIAFISTAFSAASGFFSQLMDATGGMPVLMAMLSIFFSVRFILAPIFGGSGSSDKARKQKEDN